jgi:hypothetical protein
MKITLEIKDSRFSTFLAFIKTLDYVSVSKDEIPAWQIKESEKRLKNFKKNPEQALDFDATMSDIEKDL